jgi:hypothetical protein
MIIALDYDDTYTRDPEFWDQVVALAKSRGHMVVCATMRSKAEGTQVVRDLYSKVDQIYFTDRKAKWDYVTKKLGVTPSVWIDDNPYLILMDARKD